MEFSHTPVLLQECLQALAIRPDGLYIDGTAGGGGHSGAIAAQLTTGRLLALDKDPQAIAVCTQRLSGQACAQVVQADFAEISSVLSRMGLTGADGILLDLGVSSHQLDTPERGFSYSQEAPLDMRMSGSGLSAYDVVNTYSHGELARILRVYGEERFAGRIASVICRQREQAPLTTTFELVDCIRAAIPAPARNQGGHPAKRTFQAIRMEVNQELQSLATALQAGFECLKPSGRMAIITFHSLEDRMVKQQFAEFCRGCICPPSFPVCTCGQTPKARLVSKKPILPSPQELEENKRSHSAKLRVLEKL